MRLRQLREEQKFSQADLGELLGMNQNTISRYETGVREPSIRDLVLIADYFRVSVDYLLCRTDNPVMNK